MEHMAMDEMHKIALYVFDNVAPGETKTFNYTFNQSMVGQNFEFACHLPGHKVWWSAHRFLCQNQGETALHPSDAAASPLASPVSSSRLVSSLVTLTTRGRDL
jgi:hypothetical protein